MTDHIYELGVTKTTTGSAQFIVDILPGTLGAGIRMPAIREIGIFNQSGAASEIGIGLCAAAGTGTRTASTVQSVNQLDPAGHTTVGTAYGTTQPTAPTSFYRRAELQAVAGAGVIFTWNEDEFLLWSGATINEVTIWQISTSAVTYDVYIKVAE